MNKTNIQYADTVYLINSSTNESSFLYNTIMEHSHFIRSNSSYHTYASNSTFEDVQSLGAWVLNSHIKNSILNFYSRQTNGSIYASIIENSQITIDGRAFRIYESSVIDSKITYTNANYIFNSRGYFYSQIRGFDVIVDEFYTNRDQMKIIFPSGQSYYGPISDFLQ